MNMFKKVKAKTVKEYFDAVPKERKEAVLFLHNFICKSAPKLKPHFSYNMIGYGAFPYLNSKKVTMEWYVIGLANQKNYISIYVCAFEKGQYIAEKYKKDLGKVTVGKSCISFKRIEDVNLPALKKVIQLAEKNPGFVM